jgi:hypothetical protein
MLTEIASSSLARGSDGPSTCLRLYRPKDWNTISQHGIVASITGDTRASSRKSGPRYAGHTARAIAYDSTTIDRSTAMVATRTPNARGGQRWRGDFGG